MLKARWEGNTLVVFTYNGWNQVRDKFTLDGGQLTISREIDGQTGGDDFPTGPRRLSTRSELTDLNKIHGIHPVPHDRPGFPYDISLEGKPSACRDAAGRTFPGATGNVTLTAGRNLRAVSQRAPRKA